MCGWLSGYQLQVRWRRTTRRRFRPLQRWHSFLHSWTGSSRFIIQVARLASSCLLLHEKARQLSTSPPALPEVAGVFALVRSLAEEQRGETGVLLCPAAGACASYR